MKVVFLGPPGVGKGTQATRFSKNHGLPHIATGDLLRVAISKKTEVGLEAKAFIAKGQLVPDHVIIQLMSKRFQLPDAALGYVLDGFPRTITQGKALADILSNDGAQLDRVIYFSLEDDALKERIVGRRSCPSCHSIYHLRYRTPPKDGLCGACGTALMQRDDDKIETVEARLAVYQNETAPLIAYYKALGLLTEIDASGNLDEVAELVEAVFREIDHEVLSD